MSFFFEKTCKYAKKVVPLQPRLGKGHFGVVLGINELENNKKMRSCYSLFLLVLVAVAATVFQSCEADVDLNNIDTKVDVDANLAMPIGSLRATIGDFVGDGSWGIYVDSLQHRGVLTFRDTFSIEREFHSMDLSRYVSRTTLKMNVYDSFKNTGVLNNNQIVGTGKQIPLTFPFTLKLSGINNDLSHQRMDSALIKDASFVSTISSSGGLPIKWEWIDKVVLNLGENICRQAGKEVVVYEKDPGYSFGEEMVTKVDEFSLNLMKNKNPQSWKDYTDNVIDSCKFDVTIYVTIPESAGVIEVPPTSAFQYDMAVQFIDYYAVWGMFEPSDDMAAVAEDVIAEAWSSWADIYELRLPLMDPSVDMQITTQVAGAMVMEGDYLYTKNEQGEVVYATFDGGQTLYKYFTKNEYLPLNSRIGESKTMHVLFDKDPSRGRIDRLFNIRPDKVGYKFSVKFNEQETPQLRITNNTSIKLDAVCNLPMIFNEGVELAYKDTITGIDLSSLALEDLLKDVEVVDTLKDASVKLVIKIENTIPLQFKGRVKFLDKKGYEIMDPKTFEPFQIADNNTILIAAPKQTLENYNWVSTSTESVLVVDVDKDDLEILRQINQIAFDVMLDDESLAYAYEQGLFNVRLTENNYLCVKLAVGANVGAVLNLDSIIN